MDQNIYQAYLDILQEELIPAMGCTEPIAVAYAGALARKALGRLPERVELTVSGNIIKTDRWRYPLCTHHRPAYQCGPH